MVKNKVAAPQRRRRPKAEGQDDEQYYSRTIGRALDVMECFSDERPRLSLTEISRIVELPESSLFRVLLTLQRRGYLDQDSDGTYQLSHRVLYGRVAERAEKLKIAVQPDLQALASRFNETVSFAYLFESRIQVMSVVETFHEIRVSNKPGRVLPPHCSAMGKAITAHQASAVIDQILESYGLTRRTETTITDRQSLLREFEHIRKVGYACDREESMVGGICFGAAIVPAKGGNVVAALSISTPTIRMNSQREKEISEGVVRAAREIADRLFKVS